LKIVTYQSTQVLRILQSGKIYRAYKSIAFEKEYAALIDILGLSCECPVFGCLKYHRKSSGGRVASSVLLTLDVPDEFVKLTEYKIWADFMFYMKYTKPTDYSKLAVSPDTEITQKDLDDAIFELKTQKSPWKYKVPQAILEEIRPEWLVKYKKIAVKGK